MLTFALALALQATVPAPSPQSCAYDRAAMLALDSDAFDRDVGGGWRKLSDVGCDAAAADLIHDWRVAHKLEDGVLYWHEGQMRANAGQTTQAVALFELARKPPERDAKFGWNLYVDGSVAFLRRDRAALEAAHTKLAALPKPAGFDPVGPDGKPIAIQWPLNLNVLDGFRRCWDRPYKQAYSCATTFKMERPAAK